MPARVRSERTSLSNCANAARTSSISLPVDVSSIGPVADRSERPSGTDEIFTIRLSAARVNMEQAHELPRPSHQCYLRVARRRRQGPQAHGSGSSEAKSLDGAEHNSTLTM
jgi:hypothetical protein